MGVPSPRTERVEIASVGEVELLVQRFYQAVIPGAAMSRTED